MAKRSKVFRNKRGVNLGKQLAGYSLAAGAILASGGQADGAVIYSGLVNVDFGANSPYTLTMEGSYPELLFSGGVTPNFSATIRRTGPPVYILTQGVGTSIVKLSFSQRVGPQTNVPYGDRGQFFLSFGGSSAGYWTFNGQTGYFGFSFELEANGTTAYGWGQVERLDASNGRLIDWAYESNGDSIHVGDTGAAVPEPSSLALLALGLGTAGAALRRKRKAS
jgi:hypothetical protein